MGDFVMPKHTGLLREFTVPLKVCYEKRNENEGWIPNGHATRKEEGFTYYIFQEYNKLGFETIPKVDNSDYTKDAQIPLYLGFMEGRGRNNAEKRLTPSGIKMHKAIEAGDVKAQYELLIDAFEKKTFGRNNQGFPSADSDVEVPNVLLLSSIFLGGVTRQEFYCILFLMHTKGWDLARATAKIIYFRKSGINIPEIPNIYTDCKLIPLLVSMNFLSEDDQNRLHIATTVYNDHAKKILHLKSKNEETIKAELTKGDDDEGDDETYPQQIIFYGAPGTGKSHTIKVATERRDVIRTTFHPDSDYSTFVGAYKPTTKEVPVISNFGGKAVKVLDENGKEIKEERIVYEFVSQAFLQAYVGAWENYAADGDIPQAQYLVIEEINRGNCAQIFGDLFQLLDRNAAGFSEYPIKADADLKKQLKKLLSGLAINDAESINALYKGKDIVSQVLNGDVLLLPCNLYIWATMNTSDQSLFPIDSAFKRRWDWKYIKIKEGKDKNGNKLDWKVDVKMDEEGNLLSWWDFVKKINEIIASMTSSADKQLGYFFCNANNGVINKETFVSKVIFYLWNDVFKDYGFEDASLFRYTAVDNGKEMVKDLTFPDFYDEDGDKVNTDRLTDFVKKVMNWKKSNDENE